MLPDVPAGCQVTILPGVPMGCQVTILPGVPVGCQVKTEGCSQELFWGHLFFGSSFCREIIGVAHCNLHRWRLSRLCAQGRVQCHKSRFSVTREAGVLRARITAHLLLRLFAVSIGSCHRQPKTAICAETGFPHLPGVPPTVPSVPGQDGATPRSRRNQIRTEARRCHARGRSRIPFSEAAHYRCGTNRRR